MIHEDLEARNELLMVRMITFLESEMLSFSEMKSKNLPGVYGIIIDDNVSYIGKTTRSGSTRMTELAADYRSHTLNRKLLKEYLENKLSRKLEAFNKDTKSFLITSGIISEDDFIEAQRTINSRIRDNYGFRFLELESHEIISFEHFTIGMLKPKYND